MSRRFEDIEILDERRSLEPGERRFTDVRYFLVRNRFEGAEPSRALVTVASPAKLLRLATPRLIPRRWCCPVRTLRGSL